MLFYVKLKLFFVVPVWIYVKDDREENSELVVKGNEVYASFFCEQI